MDGAGDLVDRPADDEHKSLLDRQRGARVLGAIDRAEAVIGLVAPEGAGRVVVGVPRRVGGIAAHQNRAEVNAVGVREAEQGDRRAQLLRKRCLVSLHLGRRDRLVLEVTIMRC